MAEWLSCLHGNVALLLSGVALIIPGESLKLYVSTILCLEKFMSLVAHKLVAV